MFYDWTTAVWDGIIRRGGWANVPYSIQITHGGLITIG